jgi:hypothetical protein
MAWSNMPFPAEQEFESLKLAMSPCLHEEDLDVLSADVADDVDVAEIGFIALIGVRDGLDDVRVGDAPSARARRPRSPWRRSRAPRARRPDRARSSRSFTSSSLVSSIGLPLLSW